jgi:hypothetical protein
MDGGAPAGMRMPPGEDGCLTKIRTIKIITTHGKSKTMPSGIEIEEFPRSRMRLRRKANRTDWPFSRETSSKEASAGARGMRLTMRRTIFMVAKKAPETARKQTSVSYGRVARPRPSRVVD